MRSYGLDTTALLMADCAYIDEPARVTEAERLHIAIRAYTWALDIIEERKQSDDSVTRITGPSLQDWREYRRTL